MTRPLDAFTLLRDAVARDAALRLGEVRCRSWLALPVTTAEGFALVTAMPDASQATSEAGKILGAPLRAIRAPASQLELAVARIFTPDRYPTTFWFAAIDVAHRLGKAPRPASAAGHSPGDLTAGDAARVSGATLPALIEAAALLLGLPRITVEDRLPAPLATLFTSTEVRELGAVPLTRLGKEILVATANPDVAAITQAVQAKTGLGSRFVVCSDADIRRVRDRAAAASPRLARSPLSAEDLVRGGIAPEAVAAAQQLAIRARERTEDALTRLGQISECELTHLYAARAGLGSSSLDDGEIDVATVKLLPPAARRFLGVLPFRRDGDAVRVACASLDDAWRADVAGSLMLARAIPVLVPADRLAVASSELDGVDGPLPPVPLELLDVLVSLGLVTRDRAIRASVQAERNGASVIDVLLQDRAFDADALLEARSVFTGLPRMTLTRLAAAAAPTVTTSSSPALRIAISDDETLIACAEAVVAPGDHAIDAGARPVLVGAGELEAFQRNEGRPQAQIDQGTRRFITRDGRKLGLDRHAIDGVLDAAGRGVPVDLALVDLGECSPAEVARRLALVAGGSVIDTRPTERKREVFGAFGQRAVRTVRQDPVDLDIARLITYEDATRHSLLPISREGERVTVLFANPLDTVARAFAAQRFPAHRIAVAPRDELVAAIGRVLGRRSVGDLLVERGEISAAELEEALALQRDTGVRVGRALISLGLVTQDQLANVLAVQYGLPFYDLSGMELDEDAIRSIPEEIERVSGVLPLVIDDESVTLAVADPVDPSGPSTVAELMGKRVDRVLVTEEDLEEGLQQVYRLEYLERSANDLLFRSPRDSAYRVLSHGQKVFFAVFLAVSAVALAINYVLYLQIAVGGAIVFYTVFSAYRFFIIYRAMSYSLEIPVSPEEVAALDDAALPVYTILVPMYREHDVFPILVKAMARLDYPQAKLDVKLLLEEDDKETIEAARKAHLPPNFDVLVVPDGKPKGKPKACNYGLIHARGDYAVIFDAEDIPDPDQLKKVIVAFRKAGERYACVQAKLNYFNRDQNVLTRWFTTEYSMWFDLLLPGLDRSGAPVPLGGTSNHFRTKILRDLAGWDPYNVTEDADLGMRLFKRGLKTAVIDSTTYEEANSQLGNWIRQRSRWVKGYIQTYLVHMRNPVRLWRELGTYPFFAFQMVIGGTFFGFLMNPIFWIMTTCWYLFEWPLIRELFPPPIYVMGTLGLYFGNFAFIYINVAGSLRREYYPLVKYALITPLYWMMMSLAAWKGFLQLFYKPFYWEKTQHGLVVPSAAKAPPTTTRSAA